MITAYKATRLDGTSHFDGVTHWTPGKSVEVTYTSPPDRGACGVGLHCGTTLLDTIIYQQDQSRYFECAIERDDVVAFDSRKLRCKKITVVRELGQEEMNQMAGFNLYEANNPIHPLLQETDKGLDILGLMKKHVRIINANELHPDFTPYILSPYHPLSDITGKIQSLFFDGVGRLLINILREAGVTYRGATRYMAMAYIRSLYPQQSESIAAARMLWMGGYVVTFDEGNWHLRTGRRAKVVLTLNRDLEVVV